MEDVVNIHLTLSNRGYILILRGMRQNFPKFSCQYIILRVSTVAKLPCKMTLRQHLSMFGTGGGSRESESVDDQFIGIIDDLVVMSEEDSELAEGLRWIDTQSRKQGVTFYEMAMIILRKHMAEKKAKEWLNNKLNA